VPQKEAATKPLKRISPLFDVEKAMKPHSRHSSFVRQSTSSTQNAAVLLVGIAALALVLTGCPSKTDVAKVPPPPPPSAPVASIEVNPATVQLGQSAVVSWKTENATEVQIQPLGQVEAAGSKSVTPTESTTYKILARGPGGTQEMVARVTVASASATVAGSKDDELSGKSAERLDVFFSTDEYEVSADQGGTITNDAVFLNDHPDLHIMIEGHCDELGSIEYNLALGESRATEVKSRLVKAGIPADRIETISYGKERPFCTEETESCWRLNRRAHVVPVAQR
jgi:peptidoglycan-associated lipoprotein